MVSRRVKVKGLVLDLALQRCRLLYLMAVKRVREGDHATARYLVSEAIRILRRVRARKPYYIRRWVCKNCLIPLIPGTTARVRLVRDGRESWISITCLDCGYTRRYCFKRRC